MSKGQRINSQKTRNRAKRQSIDKKTKKTKLRDKEQTEYQKEAEC